uniref:Uncharacterized protein n=1 Tax=Oryza glumipatula TaxID=40148 RepID=A0A0D9YY68_9ORYZ
MEIAVSMSARRLHATMDKIGTELRLHMRRTTTTLALHKERTEKRMKMEVTNLTWEIPWIILVDVQLPDELNGKRLLLDFPSKVESDELFIRWMKPEASELCGTIPKTSETSKFQHGVLEWSFELVTDLVSQAYLPLSSTEYAAFCPAAA